MARHSAGILPYRRSHGQLEVLLAHPGGPFWRKRQEGAWSIIKGEIEGEESPAVAARREFAEETGWRVDDELSFLGELRQAGGKRLSIFMLEADYDPAMLAGNCFTLEWPPHGGVERQFPEIDEAAWFGMGDAGKMILPSQAPALEMLMRAICP